MNKLLLVFESIGYTYDDYFLDQQDHGDGIETNDKRMGE